MQVLRITHRHGGEGAEIFNWLADGRVNLHNSNKDFLCSRGNYLQNKTKTTKKKTRHNTFFRQAKVYMTEGTMHNLTYLACKNVDSSVFWWIRVWTCNIFTISLPVLFLGKDTASILHIWDKGSQQALGKTVNAERKHVLTKFAHIGTRHNSPTHLNLAEKQLLLCFHRVFLRSWNDLHSSHFLSSDQHMGSHLVRKGDKPDQFTFKLE